MERFYERFLGAFTSQWWKVTAAAVIGAVFSLGVAAKDESIRPHAALALFGGGAVGFLAGAFLVWVDAGQARRERTGRGRVTLRERLLQVMLIVGFGLGAISILFAAIAGVVRVIAWVRSW